MRTPNTFRLATIIIVGLIIASATMFAQSTTGQMEIKMKVGSVSQDGKDKLETITVLLKGVQESTVNEEDKSITIKYNENEISDVMLQTVVQGLGYNGEIIKNEKIETASANAKDKTDKKDKPAKPVGTNN